MFRMVEAVRLVRSYTDLVVDVPDPRDVDLRREFGAVLARRPTVFSLTSSEGSEGLVATGMVSFAEDDLTDGHPSTLDHPELRDHQLRSATYEP
ncbi:hypothetical protein [Cellulomonas fengjieae]|uniref:Uncharacterized protein n=1 Tax=Cellulomonas fengjieae TaxID=2819978 RepID=A0ABS3SBJ7_9CELL|nr:hypothetical protein [Cellulomonas fengjieae]MBO3083116.1 hypothetical protein [Cellulomonas fengjieae]QVI65519.1 hypothetical protein KG102_15670 [Cellulomonas fengjieae]